jgi:hypothetical protein
LLGVFENREFKKISGPKKDEVEQRTAGDRILRRHMLGTLTKLYSLDQNKKNELGVECGTHGGKETCR